MTLRTAGLCALFTALFMVFLASGCPAQERGPQSSPRRLVETYLEAFREGDFDTMLILSGGWEGSEEELEFTRRFVDMVELKEYTIGDVVIISSSEAVVEVTVVLSLLGHEKRQTLPLLVEKINGNWYLLEGLLE